MLSIAASINAWILQSSDSLERRAADAVFRALPVVVLPGYSRLLIRAEDYRAFLAEHTYRGDRVRQV